jgi:hypothetical protein
MHELTRNVVEKPAAAKKAIREAFASAGFDYFGAAAQLGLHHYTLRKHARALGITEELSNLRARAIKRGERPDDNGRPKKPVPTAEQIVKAFVRNGCVLAETAVALGVTAPTLRRWIRDHGLGDKLASMKGAA